MKFERRSKIQSSAIARQPLVSLTNSFTNLKIWWKSKTKRNMALPLFKKKSFSKHPNWFKFEAWSRLPSPGKMSTL